MRHVTKVALLACLLALCCGLLAGCGQSAADDARAQAEASAAASIPVDVEIREKLFVAQTNDLYLNTPEYLGKTIRLEGMYSAFDSYTEGEVVHFVYRLGPGCCDYDDIVGIEVRWAGEAAAAMPRENAWVEAIGVASTYDEDGASYLYLDLLSLRTLDVRGSERVVQ